MNCLKVFLREKILNGLGIRGLYAKPQNLSLRKNASKSYFSSRSIANELFDKSFGCLSIFEKLERQGWSDREKRIFGFLKNGAQRRI